jgi:hypothetical protein
MLPTQGGCEELPHGHKGKIELFTISSFLQWGINNNSGWDVGKDEWELNLWKDEEITRWNRKGKTMEWYMEIIQCLDALLYCKYMHIPTKVWKQNYG